MAYHNEILVGRFNRALQKMFSMKGSAPAPQLSSDITAAFQFPLGNEFRYLESWFRFGRFLSAGPDAATVSGWRIRNPANSNVIAVIEKFLISVPTAAHAPFVDHGTIATDLGTVATLAQERWDPRGGPQPVLIQSAQTVGPITSFGTVKANIAMAINSFIDLITDENQEMTILPGDGLQVRTGAINQTIQISCWWRERSLEESERT